MNIYTCNTFKGYWPVGSAAVVVTSGDKSKAAQLLNKSLAEIGLTEPVTEADMQLVNQETNDQVIILCDGNY